MKTRYTIWLAILALAFVLWVPNLLALGMFMDGIYNALLSQNLYKGISTFWAPQTIYYSQPAYWDNPPLTMGILALWYTLFGDHYIVERVYSLVCAIAQAGLLIWFWRMIWVGNREMQQHAWLPVLMWIISPLTGWCYSSNVMENTMALFTTAAIMITVYCVLYAKNMVISAIAVAVLLLLAFISKGPVALFPLALPVLLIWVKPGYGFKQALIFSVLQTAFFTLFAFILFSFPEPKLFLQNYMDVQVSRALTHDMPGQYKPYQIFIELLIVISLFLALAGMQFILLKKNAFPTEEKAQLWWRLILLGLCGTIPIALSIKQRKFYLLPALMPLAVGFALLLLPTIKFISARASSTISTLFNRTVPVVCILLMVVCVMLCIKNQGATIHDEALLADIKQVNILTADSKVIRADWALYGEWSLRAYLLRLHSKKLAMPDETTTVRYYLTKSKQGGEGLPGDAVKLYSGQTVDLYQL